MSLGLRESAFPPDDATFTGAITLRLASGSASLEEVVEEFIELADDFELNVPDDDPVAPADVPAIVAAVAAEFNRCVTVTSPDAEALQLSLDALAGVQIAYLFGQAYDGAEALEMVNELRVEVEQQGVTLRGYLYSDIPALDRMILDRTLTPALREFGYREVRLIDPTCGSGHFLLGAFHRMLADWQRKNPHATPWTWRKRR